MIRHGNGNAVEAGHSLELELQEDPGLSVLWENRNPKAGRILRCDRVTDKDGIARAVVYIKTNEPLEIVAMFSHGEQGETATFQINSAATTE
ncbi:MAG: hypothetical protein ACD_76C00088G0001 [uncultured bacterium]|nr:MAG: hypothetical protein ACD_76C00088G0001 [uncultured bacterium]HBD05327.1 hypothetical protein [Candidatus Uhrbacteria bacterium]